jgi:hypothetical protein
VLRPGFLCAVAALGAGCTARNPVYCDQSIGCPTGLSCDLASNRCNPFSLPDGGGCQSNAECGTRHCVMGQCVECAVATDCSGGAVCGANHRCAPCSDDASCQPGYPGSACVDGACRPASDLAWADCAASCPGDGSLATPFCSLASAVAAARPLIVLVPHPATQCTLGSVTVNGQSVEIRGRGAALRAVDGRHGIAVDGGGTTLRLFNLDIAAVGGAALSGVSVSGGASAELTGVVVHDLPRETSAGIDAANAGSLRVSGCLAYRNHGWGLQVVATPSFAIENSFFLDNGQSGATPDGTGGARFSASGQTAQSFVYNTVGGNLSANPVGSGVKCEGSDVVALLNCLIPNDGVTTSPAGACQTTGCILATTVPMRDPSQIFYDYTRPQDSLTRCKGFHIDPMGAMASDVIGMGVPAGSPQNDVDGDPRPAQRPTPGADEPVGTCP